MDPIPTPSGLRQFDPISNAGLTAGASHDQQIKQVAEQFEAVFMSMLTKQLRESLEDGMFGGENSDTYGALFDMYLGQHLAEAGGIGLKQSLVAQYSGATESADEHSLIEQII